MSWLSEILPVALALCGSLWIIANIVEKVDLHRRHKPEWRVE